MSSRAEMMGDTLFGDGLAFWFPLRSDGRLGDFVVLALPRRPGHPREIRKLPMSRFVEIAHTAPALRDELVQMAERWRSEQAELGGNA